jgi:hypothetical protein
VNYFTLSVTLNSPQMLKAALLPPSPSKPPARQWLAASWAVLLRAGRRLRALGLVALILGGWSGPTFAINRIVLEVGELTVPGAQASSITATFSLNTRGAPSAHARAEQVVLAEPIGTLRSVELACGVVVIHEPTFACREGRLEARGGPTKSISMQAAAEYNSARGETAAEGSAFAVAGGTAEFSSRLDERGWSMEAAAHSLDVQQIRALAVPWFKVPETLMFDGHVDVTAEAANRNEALAMNAEVRTADLNVMNDLGTVVAEKMSTGLRVAAERVGRGFDIEARLDASTGQALSGPVFLNLATNPLKLEARGRYEDQTLALAEVALFQKDLTEAHGHATVVLGREPRVTEAHIDLNSLLFPAAYTSFLQIGLAATDLGQLKTTGIARGTVDIENNVVQRAQLQINDLALTDAKGKFSMSEVQAGLNWARDESASVQPSYVSWDRASAYGITGGAARLDFETKGFGFDLTKAARVPVFDGAVIVNKLSTHRLGAADADLTFDAKIEPISMAQLSRAFGWPELSGQIAGTIPGLTYRNRVLSVDGDLVASVFDGTIVGRGFRLEDPMGPWPRLFADVTARRLDLSLVTRTFAIGSITGRLDADVKRLELFRWSPVAFDARLYSTPGDRSKKLISQKAVTSLSNVGGGGGGVTAALQSGVLRFFDDFRYEALGLTCKLENDVCLMGGIEPANTGYYIVRGRGLPRIDIIGNQGRVAWPQLIAQIVTGMNSSVVVK